MARIARIVVPGLPHHVTQRGNRRGQVFFEEADYALYLDMLAESAARAQCEVWAYCLKPNHVHIILVPSEADGLRRTFADLHRRYTGYVNARARTTGHLWQGRYGSVVMDETYMLHAIRYVTLNPVRAGLVKRAEDWPWSSARAHLAGDDNSVVKVAPVLERVGDFSQFLGEPFDEDAAYAPLRRPETIGRPAGETEWLKRHNYGVTVMRQEKALVLSNRQHPTAEVTIDNGFELTDPKWLLEKFSRVAFACCTRQILREIMGMEHNRQVRIALPCTPFPFHQRRVQKTWVAHRKRVPFAFDLVQHHLSISDNVHIDRMPLLYLSFCCSGDNVSTPIVVVKDQNRRRACLRHSRHRGNHGQSAGAFQDRAAVRF